MLDYDPVTGISRYFHWDAVNRQFTIETVNDVEDRVEMNKAHYAGTDERARYGEGQRVASIPLPIYFDLKRQGILDDDKKFRAWLNDPANRHFRTRPGRV